MTQRQRNPKVIPATTFGQVIGSVLQSLRKAGNLPQASMASELELKQGGYSRLERGAGHITVSQLRRASAALKRDARWVLEVADKGATQLTARGVRILEVVPAKVSRDAWMLVSDAEVHEAVRNAISEMSRYIPPVHATNRVHVHVTERQE